jgi:DNA-binding transcriptional MerR regulator/trans-aconitate methyltransferase
MVLKRNGNDYMTAGQFADRAGVTVRTVRFYDKVGLLRPTSRSESGYRLYSEQDFARLQRILTLKYIGFSIDEIKGVINRDGPEEDLLESLRVQQTIIRRKMEHLRLVHKAIGDTLGALDSAPKAEAWNRFVSIIHVVNREEQWVDQYRDASNLHTRIRLHDRYSMNPYSWHQWLFDRLELPDRCRILELGSGDGSLWLRNLDRIPEGWKITLTDFSEGMLSDSRDSLGPHADRFTFLQADARSLPFPDGHYDAVLANHMLYLVNGREQAFREIRRVLRPGGKLYASTIGHRHLQQMKAILSRFDPKLVLSDTDFADEFGLENGTEQLTAWFGPDVRLHRYEDALAVTEAEPLLAYVRSTTGNSLELLTGSRWMEFEGMLQEIIRRDGSILIDKESGLFEAMKGAL